MQNKDLLLQKKDLERTLKHPIGWSRREFFRHGLIGGAVGALAMPSIPGLLSQMAYGSIAGGLVDTGLIPFLVFDMDGGAALAGNCLVGKSGGPEDYLKDYNLLGWNPKEAGALDNRFGLPMSAKYSKLFTGLTTVMSQEAQKRLRMGSVCHFAQLDSSSNKQNAASLVGSLGLQGSLVSNGFGTISSFSGGRSDTVLPNAAFRTVRITNVNDVIAAARFGGEPYRELTKEQLTEVASRSGNISMLQRDMLESEEGGKTLFDLAKAAYGKSLDLVQAANGLDPRQDDKIRTVFQINQNTQPNVPNAIGAAVIGSTLKGLSGAGVWTLGGCDYHSGSQNPGDQKDLEMGQMIGRAVELAHQMKKPLFFQLISDGSCSSSPGTRNWTSDTNESVTMFGYYNPDGAPEYVANRPGQMQIGAFTDGQGADRQTLVGADPSKAALAVFANYCAVNGRLNDFAKIAPGAFSATDLQKLLVFKGKTA